MTTPQVDDLKPIFELHETTRIDTFWFVRGGAWDFMGGVYTDPDGKWMGKYRFRYYNSDDAWDGADTKNVYQVGPLDAEDDTRAGLVETFTLLTKMMADSIGPDTLTTLPVNGGVEKYLAMLAQQPFTHVKLTAPEPKVPQ